MALISSTRERGLRHQLAVLVAPRAVRHVHLDPVGAVVELLARGFAGFDGSVDDLHALGHRRFQARIPPADSRRWWRCARVVVKMRGPGMVPSFTAILIPTSP